MMSSNKEKELPETWISGTRQAGGIVPAPGGSEALPKSGEGPSGGLPASPPLDSAIADENEFVIASRPGVGRRSPRGSNPRVVAVTKLDKNIKVVPGPPPPLRISELDSPRFTESAPELGTESMMGESCEQIPSTSEDVVPSDMVDVIMESDREKTPLEENIKTPVEKTGESAKKRGRPPGSGPGSNAKSSSAERHAIRKMKKSKTDLDDSEWEFRQNPGRRGTYLKKPRILASRIELGLTAKQWQAVRDKVELFDVNSAADIAAEASRQLDIAENARNKSKNIKGDLNNHIKIGIIVSKHAIYKLAERASSMGDPDMAAKDRILTLIRERETTSKRKSTNSRGKCPIGKRPLVTSRLLGTMIGPRALRMLP